MSANVEFSHLVISLAQGVKLGLGEVTNPDVETSEKDIDMANYSLGTLRMLKEKTRGNLNEDEQELIDALLNEFASKFDASS